MQVASPGTAPVPGRAPGGTVEGNRRGGSDGPAQASPDGRAQPIAGWQARSPGTAPAVRLVATDLDGTLLRPDGSVSERTVRAVRAAQAAGLLVVPVTGRPPRVTWEAASHAGLGPLGVCANGAAIVEIPTMAVVESVTIAAEICHEIVLSVRSLLPGVLFAVEDLDSFTHEDGFMDPSWGWTDPAQEVDDIRRAIDGRCMKLVMRRPGWAAVELLAALQSEIAERGHLTSSGLDWVEVGAPGVSKAYALERVCASLGVGVSEVLAVGDNHNDLTVLGWAAHAAAPANAIPEVLAAVDVVIPANTEDGVAVLLETLASSAGDVSSLSGHRHRR